MNTQKFRSLSIWLSLAAILVLIVSGALFLKFHFRKLSEQEFWVTHTFEVITELNQILSSSVDAETGARGYVLTEEAAYLDPFFEGESSGRSQIKRLEGLVGDSASQVNEIRVLESLFERRIEILEKIIEKVKTKSGNKKELSDLFDEGKIMMGMLRGQIDKMKSSEITLLEERSKAAETSRQFFNIALIVVTLISSFAIATVFYRFYRIQLQAHEEAVAKAKVAWIKGKESELSQLLSGTLTPQKVAERSLDFVSKNFPALASKLYVYEKKSFRLLAANGISEEEEFKRVIEENNLLHEALKDERILNVENVPANYWQIKSSLGSAPPAALSFFPVSFRGEKLGVIEMASFEPMDEEKRAMLFSLNEVIGAAISSAQSRFYLQELLEKTQQQSEELQTQQEELKSNNEELEQQARALEDQQQTLSLRNKELEVMRFDLEQRAMELRRSSQYKSDFLAKMSHELRTPLNGLLILSTLLMENKEKNLNDQQKQFARSIHGAGNDLLALINDILDLSKIEAKKLRIRAEDFTLSSLLEQLRTNFVPQFTNKNLSIDVDINNTTGLVRLHTDRQRLEQILRNFLSNALKFTEKGGVHIKAQLLDDEAKVKISVIDTGVGIPEEKQKLIFEAFEQADGSISRKYGGTGLGLTISRELASLLGGSIDLSSVEGKGSEFSLTIPINLQVTEDKENEGFARTMPLMENTRSSLKEINDAIISKDPESGKINEEARRALSKMDNGKRSILIVEDDDKFRQSIVDATRTYGFEPIEAADGEVALAILNAHTPDAVLLDIKLPGISGLGLLEMIKKLPHLRHIPVHMISGLDYQHNALRMGALGYLTKPVTLEKVHSALGRIEGLLSEKVRRVLLIEDDPRQATAISELVSGKDVKVTVVNKGADAIKAVRESSFECIILDLSLPDTSGVDLLDQLNDLEISIPPIVIYTAKDLSSSEEEYLRRYSESIIIKGVRSPERLLDEVNLFLHRVESLLPDSKQEMLMALRSRGESFDGKTVLLVDDDMRNVFALTSALESKGCAVRIARNGIEALESLDQHKDIDLVLMDIMMPKMDGYEAMRRIRSSEDQQIRRVPIVALTAKAMRGDHEKCIEAGANDYLPKPINMENLITVLRVWLTKENII